MNTLPDAPAWQVMLDQNGSVFADLRAGSRIGIAGRPDATARDADMIVLEARKGRVVALAQPFGGFADSSVDVLLVGDDEALDEVARHLADDGVAALKRQVRAGGFACYLMRVQCDLVEAGYENLLLSLGVAFLGACR